MDYLFQSTLRRTERRQRGRGNRKVVKCIKVFQSTLRRTERPGYGRSTRHRADISIHAPTNGATSGSFFIPQMPCNFNPRSDERSDRSRQQRSCSQVNFNPRSDERSDRSRPQRSCSQVNFNPRSDERSDQFRADVILVVSNFNPRSDERSDIADNSDTKADTDFNPRSDERSDLSCVHTHSAVFQSTLRRTERPYTRYQQLTLMHISIHAPTNGATRPEPFCRRVILNFNPRSDERSDISHSPVPAQKPISIHAPTNGATLFLCVRSSVLVISIHAPTNGATIATRPRQFLHNISIHAPTNGATLYKTPIQKQCCISIHAPTNGATCSSVQQPTV